MSCNIQSHDHGHENLFWQQPALDRAKTGKATALPFRLHAVGPRCNSEQPDIRNARHRSTQQDASRIGALLFTAESDRPAGAHGGERQGPLGDGARCDEASGPAPALSLDAKSHFAAHIADPVRLSFARRALFPSFVRLSTSTSRQFCQKPARVTGRMCKPSTGGARGCPTARTEETRGGAYGLAPTRPASSRKPPQRSGWSWLGTECFPRSPLTYTRYRRESGARPTVEGEQLCEAQNESPRKYGTESIPEAVQVVV
ncbi:hypothetical protein ACCO45_013220 [Purpureocillium lilacinum]|uniref:Uncharacterized protein n=1 Tax=Purpureocillium lilacinum TaxID=33203 RepID=A0ACC4DAV1_PURLI